MKKLFILIAIVVMIIGCAKKSGDDFTNYGSKLVREKFISTQKLIEQKKDLKWREVAVKGEIASVCTKSGRRIGLKINDTTEVHIFSIDDDTPFVFPKECVGKNAKVVGVFQIKDDFAKITHNGNAEHDKDKNHEKHDNSKEEEHHNPSGKKYIIKARGVNIYGM